MFTWNTRVIEKCDLVDLHQDMIAGPRLAWAVRKAWSNTLYKCGGKKGILECTCWTLRWMGYNRKRTWGFIGHRLAKTGQFKRWKTPGSFFLIIVFSCPDLVNLCPMYPVSSLLLSLYAACYWCIQSCKALVCPLCTGDAGRIKTIKIPQKLHSVVHYGKRSLCWMFRKWLSTFFFMHNSQVAMCHSDLEVLVIVKGQKCSKVYINK